jgi:hypothetical protein
MRVKQTTISYLAGLVDGEGYVGIKKDLTSVRNKHSKSPLYHERIQIRMSDEDAIKLFKETFGGNYYFEKKKANNLLTKKRMYCYQISDLSAANALKLLLPYLKIKKRQAQICLKLHRNKRTKLAKKRGNIGGRIKGKGRSMSQKILNYRDNLWKQIKQLNRGASNG